MNDIQRSERRMYHLGAAYETLERLMFTSADEETGEVNTDIVQALSAIQGEATDVAVGAGTVYREALAEIAKVKAEEERLYSMRKAMEAKTAALKRAIDGFCRKTGIERVDGIGAKISYKKNPPSVVIDNEADIPEEYWRIKREVDKKAVKDALQAGKPIDGAHLEQMTSIQIK